MPINGAERTNICQKSLYIKLGDDFPKETCPKAMGKLIKKKATRVADKIRAN